MWVGDQALSCGSSNEFMMNISRSRLVAANYGGQPGRDSCSLQILHCNQATIILTYIAYDRYGCEQHLLHMLNWMGASYLVQQELRHQAFAYGESLPRSFPPRKVGICSLNTERPNANISKTFMLPKESCSKHILQCCYNMTVRREVCTFVRLLH